MDKLALEHTALDEAIAIAMQSPKIRGLYVDVTRNGDKTIRIPGIGLCIEVYAVRSGTHVTKGNYQYTNALVSVVGDNKGSKADDTLWLHYSTFFKDGDTADPILGLGERYIAAYEKLNGRGKYDILSRYPKSLEQLKTIAGELGIPACISWNAVCNEALAYLLPHKA